MALGTGQRNIAAALVVASQSFSDPKVIVMVIVVAIVGLIILMPVSRPLATRNFSTVQFEPTPRARLLALHHLRRVA
jgi:predicted Na+-dependent transporter